jgi:GT2 family glycosyltransferase
LNKNKHVAVVILNWNRREMLLDCICNIRHLRYPVSDIIVVDNASGDGSVEAVRKAFPDTVLVVNDKNYGAQEGKNIGLRRALQTPADAVFMVDNDIIVDPDSLGRLLETAESDPTVGMVGAKMYDYGKPGVLLSAGGIIDYTQNVGRGRGDGEVDHGQYDRIEEVDYLWGGALLVKREILETVGLFDPGYVGYWFEDTDLSVRVRKAGYGVLFNPFAKVWHKPHATIEQFSYRKKYMAARNAVRFMKKHAKPRQWVKYTFFVVAGFPVAAVRDLIRHGTMEGVWGKMRGFFEGLLLKVDLDTTSPNSRK